MIPREAERAEAPLPDDALSTPLLDTRSRDSGESGASIPRSPLLGTGHNNRVAIGAGSSPSSPAGPASPGSGSFWQSAQKRQWMFEEAQDQLWLGLPIAGTYVQDFLMQTVSLSFVGHLGTLQLAAAAVASSLINVTGFSLLEGLASAMETICGQSYGAEDYLALGDVAQRVHLILTAFCTPLAIVLLYTRPILIHLGQDAAVAELAAQYIVCALPGLFLYAAFLPINKFMEVQGATMPLTFISSLSFALHIALNPLCIYTLKLGFVGASIAYSVTNLAQLLMAVLYLTCLDQEGLLLRCWRGWSVQQACQGWGPYLTLAIPSCLMICLEWWFFEALIFFAGLLPNPQENLAAMSISLQSEGVLFMLPLAMSIAASVRVSNELGAGDAPAAKYAAIVAVALALLFGMLCSLVLFLGQSWIPHIFIGRGETGVIERTATIMPWLIGCETGFSVSTVLSGIVRGSGQQDRGSLVNLVSFYALGLPTAYFCAFRPLHWGVAGLWAGIVGSVTFQTGTLLALTSCTNWSLQVDRAEATIEANKVDAEEEEEEEEEELNGPALPDGRKGSAC